MAPYRVIKRLATKSLLCALTSFLLSCYSPTLNAVIYRCSSDKKCPSGLICSDGFCVVDAIPGCTKGGIIPQDSSFTVCPGNSNGCAPAYTACPASMTSPLCQNISSIADMSGPSTGGADGGVDMASPVVLTPAMCTLCCPR